MSRVSMKQKLIILIAIVVVLAVAIIIVNNKSGGDGGASAENSAITNEGFVVEDTATVQVDIPDNEKKAKKTTEAAADE